MENTVTKAGFRKKFLGDKAFYKMVLAIAIPIMIQNGITNFCLLYTSVNKLSQGIASEMLKNKIVFRKFELTVDK